MTNKYKIRKSAVANSYFVTFRGKPVDVYDSKEEATYNALIREGHELIERLDQIQRQLEQSNMIRESDPYGWRA